MALDPTTASLSDQRLATVQRDLETCGSLLSHWQGCGDTTPGGYTLHSAIAALMRAVATLAQVVEDQQA